MNLKYQFFLICFFMFASRGNASIPTKKQIYGCEQPVEAALFESGLLYSEKTNSGSSKDFLELLAHESGCEFHIEMKPRARIWREIESGDTGITINGLINEERKKFAGFAPYMSGKNLVIIKKDVGRIRSFKDLERRSDIYIGAVRSYKHGRDIDVFLARMRKADRVKEYSDDTALAKAFALGATSVMFQQGLTYQKILEDHNLTHAVYILDLDKGPMTGAAVFSQKKFSLGQIHAWQKLVDRLRHEGKIKHVFRKFFSEDTCQKYLLQ